VNTTTAASTITWCTSLQPFSKVTIEKSFMRRLFFARTVFLHKLAGQKGSIAIAISLPFPFDTNLRTRLDCAQSHQGI